MMISISYGLSRATSPTSNHKARGDHYPECAMWVSLQGNIHLQNILRTVGDRVVGALPLSAEPVILTSRPSSGLTFQKRMYNNQTAIMAFIQKHGKTVP